MPTNLQQRQPPHAADPLVTPVGVPVGATVSASDAPATLQQRFAPVQALDAYLGEPSDSQARFSLAHLMALDEREEFPEAACQALNCWGLQAYYVPQEFGGQLRCFDLVFALVRLLAQRDLTVAIAHAKTYLGAMGVWVAGSDAQRRELARRILAGAAVSLGLTEREHGSDLLHGETQAHVLAGEVVLDGEKWLVNNATRSDSLTVLARTQANAGPRGYSLLLVHKDRLAADSFRCLPRIKTLGVRGADISGIRFTAAHLPCDAVVGGLGSGLEVVLRSLQISRTVCTALSLGVWDAGFRSVFRFARERVLYGKRVLDLAHSRNILARAFIELMVADCLALTVTRALHVLTSQMSVLSAVVKYFVPSRTDATFDRMALVLGARHYLREAHELGRFQKALRDSRLVLLFDGSGPVNLHAIVQQLSLLARRFATPKPDAARLERLAAVFDLTQQLPAFDAGRLTLSGHGHDSILQTLPWLVQELTALAAREASDAATAIAAQAQQLLARVESLFSDLLLPSELDESELFNAAEIYCACIAAASCLFIWYHNRAHLGGHFASGWWLALAVAQLLGKEAALERTTVRHAVANAMAWADELIDGRQRLSIIAFRQS